MKKYIYEGKTKEEAKEKAKNELNLTEENMSIKVLEEKQSLLKKNVKIEVIDINDLVNYIKEILNQITSLMNIEINLEIRRREKNIEINF